MLTPAALLADGQWKPGFIATSQNIVKENGLTQYCRKGVIEDPWLSVGEHPSSIVYGEGSYEGHNEDDALNFGGSNVSKRSRLLCCAEALRDGAAAQVWINSVRPNPYDVRQEYGHMVFEGEDWYLVRRAKGDTWHPVNDNAQGTMAYGQFSTNPLSPDTFGVMYHQFAWDKILFASGDLSLWVTMARSVVQEFDDPETFVRVITFSLPCAESYPYSYSYPR